MSIEIGDAMRELRSAVTHVERVVYDLERKRLEDHREAVEAQQANERLVDELKDYSESLQEQASTAAMADGEVERVRDIIKEAADEIERLQGFLKALRNMLHNKKQPRRSDLLDVIDLALKQNV